MAYRDLDKVRVMIKEATNLDISYAFDDLVFPEHAAFMIQYNDVETEDFFCFFHKDCLADAKTDIFGKLTSTFNRHGSTIAHKGGFVLNQVEDKIEIAFV